MRLRGRKFVLSSAFQIKIDGQNPLGIVLSIDLPSPYTEAETNMIRIGFAKVVSDATLYSYSRNECSPIVVEYPEVSRLTFSMDCFDTSNGQVIPEGSIYTLELWFEPLTE